MRDFLKNEEISFIDGNTALFLIYTEDAKLQNMKIICKSYNSTGKRCKREAEGNFSFCAVHRWERWDSYGRYTKIPHNKKKSSFFSSVGMGKAQKKEKVESQLCGHPIEADGIWSKCTRVTKGDKCWQHGGGAKRRRAKEKGQTNLFEEL